MASLDLRTIAPEQAAVLRSKVLRPGKPLTDSLYPNEGGSGTLILGLYLKDALVGTGSIFPERPPPEQYDRARMSGQAWRIRGMAILQDQRSQGHGGTLLDSLLAHARKRHAEGFVWCNARQRAANFYARAGFLQQGQQFEPLDRVLRAFLWRVL